MIRLTLVCSAATLANRRSAFPVDEPLDARGAQDAAALAGAIAAPDRALTSPALRARQTATALRLTAEVDDTLRDLDYGKWAGSSLVELQQREPDAVAAWLTDADASPHDGESIAALFGRTRAFLSAHAGDDGTLVAVTHAALMRAAIAIVLEAPLSAFWRIDVAPLMRVTVHSDGGRWRLRSMSGSSDD